MCAGDIFLFGAGGHAKVVIDVIEREGRYRIAFIADDGPGTERRDLCGYPVLGGREEALSQAFSRGVMGGLVAIGDNRVRLAVERWMGKKGLGLVAAVHPSAQLARGVRIAEGTVVMAGVVINTDSVIGRSVIVNTAASIDHDCSIDDGAHIAPGCRLCGNVRVGRGAFVGAGSTVVPGVSIGESAVVGAGSVVIEDVAPGAVVAGNPCRPTRRGGI